MVVIQETQMRAIPLAGAEGGTARRRATHLAAVVATARGADHPRSGAAAGLDDVLPLGVEGPEAAVVAGGTRLTGLEALAGRDGGGLNGGGGTEDGEHSGETHGGWRLVGKGEKMRRCR